MSEPPPPTPPEPNAARPPPVWRTMAPALRAALFDPQSWHESLEAYASPTQLAVVLVDAAGRQLGPCHNPRPTWSWLYAHQQVAAAAAPHTDTPGAPPQCPFVLAPDTHCPCVGEALAQRVQHFALLGQLAAGVSHEIRNPLGAAFLHVDLLTEEIQQPTPDSPAVVAAALTEIKISLARMEALVQDYLSLVRVGNIEPTVQDLGAAMEAWATEFHLLAAPRGVTLQREGLAALGPVAVHAATLRRAVLNLVQNALEAMPQGGRLTLTGRSTLTHVQLQVRDTGSGIPAAQHTKIFEPLYTTKSGRTGLGLYIVQKIVAAHGGQVTVESAEGHGTVFTLTLPRAVGEAEAAQ